MSEQSANPLGPRVPRHAVAENLGGAYWSVSECRWESVAPALPDDLVDLLAPPIEVGAAPCGVDVSVDVSVDATCDDHGDDRDGAAAATALDHLDMLVYDPRGAMIAPAAPRRVGRHRRALRVG
jgi:hypothetical protein